MSARRNRNDRIVRMARKGSPRGEAVFNRLDPFSQMTILNKIEAAKDAERGIVIEPPTAENAYLDEAQLLPEIEGDPNA